MSVGSGDGRSWKDDKFPGGRCHAPAFALHPEPLGVLGELLKAKLKKKTLVPIWRTDYVRREGHRREGTSSETHMGFGPQEAVDSSLLGAPPGASI